MLCEIRWSWKTLAIKRKSERSILDSDLINNENIMRIRACLKVYPSNITRNLGYGYGLRLKGSMCPAVKHITHRYVDDLRDLVVSTYLPTFLAGDIIMSISGLSVFVHVSVNVARLPFWKNPSMEL